jgi:hypothetical protein
MFVTRLIKIRQLARHLLQGEQIHTDMTTSISLPFFIMWRFEDGGDTLLRNVGNHLQDHNRQLHRRVNLRYRIKMLHIETKERKIGKVYSSEYTEIPKMFNTHCIMCGDVSRSTTRMNCGPRSLLLERNHKGKNYNKGHRFDNAIQSYYCEQTFFQ